jgi:phosphohistidine phosphatase
MVLLVHHADALAAHLDAQRPLSAQGLDQAARLAAEVKSRGFAPAVIWHSGKMRGRQTAEAFLRICNPFAEFKMVRGLRSEDPAEWMRDELVGELRDMLLVGHMPNIADLARLMAATTTAFPLNGAIAFERKADEKIWKEAWRAQP